MNPSVESSTLCYLTKNNLKRLQSYFDYDKFNSTEEIYKVPFFFFGKKEEKTLLCFKEFLMDTGEFISKYYKPVEVKDNYQYMYEGYSPAYHANPNCIRITSDFNNIKIPQEIKERGSNEVVEFRNWYKEKLKEIGKTDIKNNAVFRQELWMKFAITFEALEEVNYENSGIENFENLSLPELEKRIDALIGESKFYFVQSSPSDKEIIRQFQKRTSWGYVRNEIQGNNTNLSDDELKSFLRSYDIKFKQPVRNLLLEYYRVLYNPQLRFEGDLLSQLNFKPCGSCYSNDFTD